MELSKKKNERLQKKRPEKPEDLLYFSAVQWHGKAAGFRTVKHQSMVFGQGNTRGLQNDRQEQSDSALLSD
jgi:hypothetical protein